MAYDTRCFDLAEVFLSDDRARRPNYDQQVNELAQEIQDAIEDWLMMNPPGGA